MLLNSLCSLTGENTEWSIADTIGLWIRYEKGALKLYAGDKNDLEQVQNFD